ncbi:MAG TPA: lytic transglycosylase domain-containing protein [Bdellovibrionota bacterium]|nr:lytic transglycosylase domain-containing protein [Bdellovibrionota bacterium]
MRGRLIQFGIICAAALAPGRAPGLPMETANLLSQGFEAHILTIMPQAKFSVDERMKRNVEFWIRIYTEYTTAQGLIHDAKYIDKVYEVIDFPPAILGDRRANRKYSKQVKAKWKDLLHSVHAKRNRPEMMSEEERKVFALYSDVNEPGKFLEAASRKRLRIQLGQKDRFIDGLFQSGRYLAVMEEIFRKEGLPVELTRLPFVESSFNVKARSKVGASGIWQFMRYTGKLYLKVNDAVDERNDPIRATEAAAKLLKHNYEALGNWPLAVTAYNHGREGMMRAVRKIGSEELEEVVSDYRSRSFGFASSNFFTELLAAIEVERNAERYFGSLERAKPMPSFEVEMAHYVKLDDLVREIPIDAAKVRELNQGLLEPVYEGTQLVPKGYRLRLPYDGSSPIETATQLFLAAYEKMPAELKRDRQIKYSKYGRRR